MVLCEDEQTTRGRELQVPPRLATRGEEKNVCMSEVCVKVFPSILKSTAVGGVCMEARTDSPATPLPKSITASTNGSHY